MLKIKIGKKIGQEPYTPSPLHIYGYPARIS